jgi:hypothetical protein
MIKSTKIFNFKNIKFTNRLSIKLFSSGPKHSTDDSSNVNQNAFKEFEKRVNTIAKNENDDYSSVEHYMKVFNEKVYKQNLDLSNKLSEIFKEDTQPSGAKIFTAINEINKINLNNSSALLQVFLNQILKYNDSVRLFIQQSEKKSSRYSSLIPLSIFLIWISAGIFIYSFLKNRNFNYEKVFENLCKNYNDNASKLFKIDVSFPIFDDHKNVTNSINFDEHSHIVLIGPRALGKTESVKHFCLSQCLKDNLALYIDLNTSESIDDVAKLERLVRNKLIENYTGKEISHVNASIVQSDEFARKLNEYLRSKRVFFVFDNYNMDRDKTKIFNIAIPSITEKRGWKSLIISDNNEIVKNAITHNLTVKYLNFIQTRSYKNYLVEKLNTYCKKRVEYSNLELFTEDNMNLLFKNFYFFSFKDLADYLDGNNSIKSKLYFYSLICRLHF